MSGLFKVLNTAADSLPEEDDWLFASHWLIEGDRPSENVKKPKKTSEVFSSLYLSNHNAETWKQNFIVKHLNLYLIQILQMHLQHPLHFVFENVLPKTQYHEICQRFRLDALTCSIVLYR